MLATAIKTDDFPRILHMNPKAAPSRTSSKRRAPSPSPSRYRNPDSDKRRAIFSCKVGVREVATASENSQTHVVALPRLPRKRDLVEPLVVHSWVGGRRKELRLQELLELRDRRKVVSCRLVKLDHEDQLRRLLTLVEVDLMRLLAQHVGIAIADEGPVGEIDACRVRAG